MKTKLTEAEVIAEIERLKNSPYVKIAKYSDKLRQRLYTLRSLEKRGRKMVEENENLLKENKQ